jgi:uncharacterized membrane protein YGL010W
VPVIAFSTLGLAWAVAFGPLNLGLALLVFALGFYLRLSPRLGLVMLPFAALLAAGQLALSGLGLGLALGVNAALFVLAWIAQLIGHKIEGKKPSFADDLSFLLIGPPWVLAPVLRAAGVVGA